MTSLILVTFAEAGLVPERGARRALIVAILLSVVACAFEAYAILTAMPAAARELGALDLYAWAFTAFVIAMSFATVLAGRMVDKVGTVKPLLVGGVVFAGGLLAAGFALSMPWLLFTRMIQGLGAGTLNVALMVLVAHAFSDAERPALMTAFSFCWVLPSFIGPPVAGWIAHAFGWRWVFWSTLPLLVVSAVVGWRPLADVQRRHEILDSEHDPVPVWAAALAAMGVALLQLAGQRLSDSPDAGDPPGGWPVTVALAVLAIGLLLIAVPRLMPPGVAQLAKGLPAVALERSFQSGAFFTTESFIPLLLGDEQGFTLVQAGGVLTIGSVGWTLGSWLQSRPWLKLRRDQIILAGAILGLAGVLVVLVGVITPGASWVWVAVGHVIAGTGMGLSVASTSLATMTLSPPETLGRNTSSLQVAEALGNSLVTAVAGTAFVMFHHQGRSWITYGWLIGICALAVCGAIVAAARIGPVRNDSAGVG